MHSFINWYFWEYNMRKAVGLGEKHEKKKVNLCQYGNSNILVCEEQHFPAVPTATRVNMDVAAFVDTSLQNLLKRLGKLLNFNPYLTSR
jgi:hypothetical protein